MKKLTIMILALCIVITAGYGRDLPARKTNVAPGSFSEKVISDTAEVGKKVKEFLEIQKKMFDIERNAIQQDEDLKRLAEQIRQLQQQLRERVEEKLKANEEYQALKQQRDQIKDQYRQIDFRRPLEQRRKGK